MPNDDDPQRTRIRVGWLAPFVAASIVLGVVVALGATGQMSGSPTSDGPAVAPTAPTADRTTPGMPEQGDLESADLWFKIQGLPATADAHPYPERLKDSGIDPASVRFVLSQNADISVWVATSQTGQLCLLAVMDDQEGTGAQNCSSREDFAKTGVELGANDFTLTWLGEGVTVERATN